MVATTRLALYKPTNVELTNPQTSICDQMDVIDNVAIRVLTNPSTSPPIGQFLGQEWFTADTHELFTWNGASWTQVLFDVTGDAGTSGRKAYTINASPVDTFNTTAGQENGPQLHTHINVVNGHTYLVYVSTSLIGGTSRQALNENYLRIRVAPGGAVTNTGTLIYQCHADFPDLDFTGMFNVFMVAKWVATFTGPASFGVFLFKDVGKANRAIFECATGLSNSFTYMAIEGL